MPRTFDNVNDRIACAVGNCNIGYGTLAAIVRRTVNGATDAILSLYNAGGEMSLMVDSTNALQYVKTSASSVNAPTITVLAADGWNFVAATKATGTQTVRFHRYKYSTGVWTHENSAGTLADSAAGASVEIGSFGGGANWWPGDIEALGAWSRVLADDEIEPLAYNWWHWLTSGAAGLWLLDQSAVAQTVIDHTGGGANQTAITDTTVGTNSVPIFNRAGVLHLENSGVVQTVANDVATAVVSNPGSRRARDGRRLWRRWGTVSWDSFNRLIDQSTDGLGRADSSLEQSRHVWEETAQGGAPIAPYFTIRNGKAQLRKTVSGVMFYSSLPTGMADVQVGVSLTLGTTITSPGPGLYLRGSPEGTALLLTAISTTQWQWSQLVSGVVTPLLIETSPVTLVSGTEYRLEARLRGSRVRAYLNGTQIGTDQWFNIYQTETLHGIFVMQDAEHLFDNFRIFRG